MVVTRMASERQSKRGMLAEVDGVKDCFRRQEHHWTAVCLEHDLELFNLPIETEPWTLAAKKQG